MAESQDFEALCKAARKLLRAGQLKEAVETFEKAKELNEADVELHDGLATAYFMQDNYEAAIRHFNRVAQLDPRRGTAFINLGAVYNRMGNYNKAVEILRRGLQMEKKCSAGFYNLGIAYRQLKQWNMAVPAYREAIRIDPKMAEAYQNLGNVYLEMGNLQQSISQFKKALEVRPDFPRAQRGLEKAQDAVTAAKTSLNPFGRLVNQKMQDDAAAADTTVVSRKEMSETERNEDRKTVYTSSLKIRSSAQTLVNHLRDSIEPAVRQLNRALAEQASEPATLSEAHDDFLESKTLLNPMLKQLNKDLQELRDHEASLQ